MFQNEEPYIWDTETEGETIPSATKYQGEKKSQLPGEFLLRSDPVRVHGLCHYLPAPSPVGDLSTIPSSKPQFWRSEDASWRIYFWSMETGQLLSSKLTI